MTIGERIKQKRIELDLSQDELAKKVGYKSRSSIQKIESARNLPLPKVEKMARALGCTPSYLMGWEYDNPGIAVTERGQAYVVWPPSGDTKEEEEFIQLYQSAPAEIQQAVLTLLKSAKHDS